MQGCLRSKGSLPSGLSRARITVEHAFDRLKGRRRCVPKCIDYHIGNVPHVVAALLLHVLCCTAHARHWVIGVRMIGRYKMIQILLKMKEARGLIIKKELLQTLVLPPAVSSEMLLPITSLHCNLYFYTAQSSLLYAVKML